MAAALAEHDLPVPDAAGLRSFVGPPMPASMRAQGVPEDSLTDVIATYRRHFTGGGMWDSHVFDGIPGQLEALRRAGCTLAVATSKPEIYARPICERYGISALVDGVYGAPLDHVPSTKATVITHALTSLDVDPRSPGRPVLMVGDRHHDVGGATEHGIPCLGVGWGYAEPGELDGAVGVVDDVAGLTNAVLAAIGRSSSQHGGRAEQVRS
ncbi:haloacid dehalogenase [Litorihabitans aurantiacus]|uniref:Haloacid dehalogenase n=1 Tax=Litorihabitans aurantiacus TaxID=1930061 RepID=A0AA37XES5_9MICO|nr:haloacid dehalogenase [Litorihabitans aurantiacus]